MDHPLYVMSTCNTKINYIPFEQQWTQLKRIPIILSLQISGQKDMQHTSSSRHQFRVERFLLFLLLFLLCISDGLNRVYH